MVEIEIEPWKKIVIHEAVHYDCDELVRLSCIGVPPGGLGHGLRWAEGILFRYTPFPPSEAVMSEQLNGVIHISSIEWAEMTECKDVIIINETNVKLPVVDCSNNTIQKAIAGYLKKSVEPSTPLIPLKDAEE